MAEASVAFALGLETVTSVLEIDLEVVTPISGDFGGLIPAGTHAHIAGDVNLTGDFVNEGYVTGIDAFTVEGNGFQILGQNGGRFDLAGVQKSAWVYWGEPVVGWQVGDRLAVAPTKVNVFVPTEITWGGSWAATARPVNSQSVTLLDGRVVEPEVLNLSQTIVLKNLTRFHFHDTAGVQSLRYLRVLDAGVAGLLAHYPVHFHHLGEAADGSLVEGVVVEGGKHNAFVPHGSHGITFRDTAGYKITGLGYWWDYPTDTDDIANNSNDILWDHALALMVTSAGFVLGAGSGNSIIDSSAVAVQGGTNGPGYSWPSDANQNVGGVTWDFHRNRAHNNKKGIFAWQNDFHQHDIEDFIAYRNKQIQIEHGAYTNNYRYRRMVLMGGSDSAFTLHARGNIVIEDVLADKRLLITKHLADATAFAIVRRCVFPSWVYNEMGGSEEAFSWIRYEDCGLTPSDFTFITIHPESIIEITEAGVLTHRWAGGWT